MPVVAASNVPLWAALLVGLGGGVFGTLVGTLLTISHERGAEFRTRMLTAADDFLRTGTQLAQSIGAAEAAIIAKEPDAQVEPLWRAFQESSSRFALEYSRVQLLFGAESRAFTAAVVAAEHVDKARQALRSMRNQPGSVTHQVYEKAFLEACGVPKVAFRLQIAVSCDADPSFDAPHGAGDKTLERRHLEVVAQAVVE